MGNGHPIRIQSMTSTRTTNIRATLDQCIRLFDAGADYVRISIPDKASITALKQIKKGLRGAGYDNPLIADIHFKPELALLAAPIADKLRINPGNYTRASLPGKTSWTQTGYNNELRILKNKLAPLAGVCKDHGTAIRIGTNLGSLSPRIVSRFGNTPEAMVEATQEFLRAFEELGFFNTVISLKASNPLVMIRAYHLLACRLMSENMAYPLHLGVTEAGAGEDGRLKSALGIGTLLKMGIGDTVRVSLTEEPEAEIAFARILVAPFRQRKSNTPQHKLVLPPFQLMPTPALPFYGEKNSLIIATPGSLPWKEAGLFNAESIPPDATSLHPRVNIILFRDTPSINQLEACRHMPGPILVADTTLGFELENLETLQAMTAQKGIQAGIMLKFRLPAMRTDRMIAGLATQFGGFLLRRIIHGLWMETGSVHTAGNATRLAQGLLQACGIDQTRTEYVSCPTCSRTSYDLQGVLKNIRDRLPEVPGLKIAVMGCIVNGPGEMADADFGVMGSKNGTLTIYRGKTPVKKHLNPKDAAEELFRLLKQSDWIKD